MTIFGDENEEEDSELNRIQSIINSGKLKKKTKDQTKNILRFLIFTKKKKKKSTFY